MNSKKLSLAALLIFIAIAIITLYYNISPYISPSQLLKLDYANDIQVVGKITDLKAQNGMTFFKLTDGNAAVEVIYKGSVQHYDSEVVVVGDWKDGVLYAKEVLRKCHTEYTGG
ncbi:MULTISPECIES: cytochrome c maturation protein CcmE [unclassified Archaeoglobus]|jgi:cytochrome c-type biogenesis protein CcmE|uniref:cytochrome c maturation protein CcmE domain-containing protein n=1 Tax=unclassified Archaeoglobus TaxID=2643606 RepID=UPI0025B875E1|nr:MULTISPECIES: cytochrome c maturation protein CcmE [unclassified Archaeoglobus]